MSVSAARLALLLLGVWSLGPATRPAGAAPPATPNGARVGAQERVPALQADSADLLARAREAQGRFERRRRQLLPHAPNAVGGPCRERVGRLCVRSEGDAGWVPAPDAPEVIQERDRLLEELGEIGGRVPGDAWILGQRVRYLNEAGRWNEAAGLARACPVSDRWWCRALVGFTLHVSGRYEAALQAFEEALASMDPEEARRWRDPHVLLDGDASDVVDGAAAEDRERIRSELWALADPLYLVPGNDRESEHYARWTFSKLNESAENVWGMPWGGDHEEVTIRYGWERGWERLLPQAGTVDAETDLIGHRRSGGKEFIPPGAVLEAPWTTEPGSWTLSDDAPRSAHVAAYAPELVAGEAQVAVFPRGATMVVAAATGVPVTLGSLAGILSLPRVAERADRPDGPIAWPPPPRRQGPDQVGLFLVGRNGDTLVATRETPEGALGLAVPAGDYVLSVEAWSPAEGVAARRRHGVSLDTIPDDLATLSDLVLLEAGDSLPRDLEEAVPAMRASTRLRPNERIVVGWEVTGLGVRRENATFELSLRSERTGFFRRIGGWLGVAGPDTPVRVGWEEPGPSELGPWFRSVELTLPDVAAGSYVLRLEVATPGRETLVETRVVQISP